MKNRINNILTLIFVFVFSAVIFIGCSGGNKNTFTVTFKTNGGDYISPLEATQINSSPVVIRDGYHFEGWYYDNNFINKVNYPITLTSDITLHAKWRKTLETVRDEFAEFFGTSKTHGKTTLSRYGNSLTATYNYVFDSRENLYETSYLYTTMNFYLSFEFGNFIESTGGVSYESNFYYEGDVSGTADTYFSVLNLNQHGKNYTLNGNHVGFYTSGTMSDTTRDEIYESISTYFSILVSDIKVIVGNTYKDIIFDYA